MRLSDLTRLGDGPVATVYSGHHDGAPVALKVFPKQFDKRTMTAFTKEQSLLSGLRRVASILPVDAVDEVEGKPALRMELCPDSLASFVDSGGPLPAADVVALGRAVALALAAAHDVGVVHGGLSPHNVLFRASGEPVVSDFGLTLRQALARDPLHAIEFLPPETLRAGTLTRSTDLYSLGALLHYALVGRTPHPGRLGEQPGERVLRILGKPVPAINAPDVPVAMATLVARLLAADPTHRPADATEVAARLGGMLPDVPAEPEPDFDDFAGAPEATTRDTSLWGALARRENTRPQPPREPVPVEPPEEPARDKPAREVLAWEMPVRDALGWDQQLQDEQTREMPPQHAAPDPQVAEAPTQDARPRQESDWARPFQVAPDGQHAVGPKTPAQEPDRQDDWEALPDVVALEERAPVREVPGRDEPFWEMPALADGSAAPRASAPASPTSTPAWGAPRLEPDASAGDTKRSTRWRVWAGVAGGALAGALSVLLVVLFATEPDELATSRREPADGGAVVGDVRLELSPPVDEKNRVKLQWRSTRQLDFAVVVAGEGKKAKVLLAQHRNEMTVDVEPGLKYCFMIQGTDSDRVYESRPVPLRGATCRK